MSSKSIISVVLIYGILNLILWGGQELYYYEDTREINQIEKWLEEEKQKIFLLEQKIDSQSIEIEQEENKLTDLENRRLTTLYNSNVDSYNYLLEGYENDFDIYDEKIAKYNNKVNRFNELIKKSGSRWYLIPIPLPTKSIKSKL